MNRFLALVLTMMLTFSKAYAFNFDEWMDTNVAPISDAIANVIFYQINLFGVKVPIIICWVLFAGIFFTIYFIFLLHIVDFIHYFQIYSQS